MRNLYNNAVDKLVSNTAVDENAKPAYHRLQHLSYCLMATKLIVPLLSTGDGRKGGQIRQDKQQLNIKRSKKIGERTHYLGGIGRARCLCEYAC